MLVLFVADTVLLRF